MHITNAETDVDKIDQIAYAPEMLLVELLVGNIEWIYIAMTPLRGIQCFKFKAFHIAHEC